MGVAMMGAEGQYVVGAGVDMRARSLPQHVSGKQRPRKTVAACRPGDALGIVLQVISPPRRDFGNKCPRTCFTMH